MLRNIGVIWGGSNRFLAPRGIGMQQYGFPTLGIGCGIGRNYAADYSGVVSPRNVSGTVFGGYGQDANMHSCKSFGSDRIEPVSFDPYSGAITSCKVWISLMIEFALPRTIQRCREASIFILM